MSPEISKPEWFQLADEDQTPVKSSRRQLRALALAAPLLVVGVGLAYAQTQDSSPATAAQTTQSANNPIAISSTSATAATTPTASTGSSESSSGTVAATTSGGESNSVTTAPAQTAPAVGISQSTTPPAVQSPITAPSIKMPTGGGDDDGQEQEQESEDD